MLRGFPGGSVIENPPANAEDMEDPTCHGETKPLSHDYWACALELGNRHYLLSPCTRATAVRMLHTTTRVALTCCNWGKARTAVKTQHSQNNFFLKLQSSEKAFFIWLHWVLAAAHRLSSCNIWTLSCKMWDLAPWPRIKPGPSALRAQSLSYRQGSNFLLF